MSDIYAPIKELLLEAPDSQLDAALRPLVEKWSNPATSLQILEVLDHCIYGGMASEYTVRLLQALYERALVIEHIEHSDNVPAAIKWRGCPECGSKTIHKMDCGSKSRYPL